MFTGTPGLPHAGGGQAQFSLNPAILLFSIVAALGLCCGLEAQAQSSPVSKEYQLKAALLYNFTKYVEWPEERFSSPESPIVIGVIGKNPFAGELEQLVAGRKLNGRVYAVKYIASIKEIPSVHVLFVAAGEEQLVVGDTMDLIQAPGILTVGETEQFTVLGGTITFVMVSDKVHFEIKKESADRAKIKLSPQLLKLSSRGRKRI